jgi:hypothetical protein
MWVEFTLTEGGNPPQVFRIPVGGLALIDPQGVVYDGARFDQAIAAGKSAEQARATAAISGATVRLQRLVSGAFVNVLSGDPGITPNVNPQTTAANGIYQWDVQAGTYRVAVTAPGCQDAVSQAVDIPPPALDLHVRMTCSAGSAAVPTATATAAVTKAKPGNNFSFGKKAKSSKSGMTVTLEVNVPGPGQVKALDSAVAGATKSKAKAGPLFNPVSMNATGAGIVKVTLKLSKQGQAKLREKGKVNAKATVTFVPTGGDAATQETKISFKKAPAKEKKG